MMGSRVAAPGGRVTERPPSHPARFSQSILDKLAKLVVEEAAQRGTCIRVLDPFAGTGRIHELRRDDIATVGVEIEIEWAGMNEGTIVGDARDLPFEAGTFDVVMTSPCYGNRFADHHNAKDPSKRRSYTHDLGRALSEGNAGVMHWAGKDKGQYKELHRAAWQECYRVLADGALFVVNVSNHIRGGTVMPVVEWHMKALLELGLFIEEVQTVTTQRDRYGENKAARVPKEHILIMRKSTTCAAHITASGRGAGPQDDEPTA